MLSIAVCDDNIIECSSLSRRIRGMVRELGQPCILRQFGSGRELLGAKEQFDLVFLDLLMEEPDGMETARLLRKKAFGGLLVFVSVSREYVFEAYDVEAFSYLLKPVDTGKLGDVLRRALSKQRDGLPKYLLVSKERQQKKLFLRDIWYFEIQGRVLEVHGVQGVFSYYGQIGALEEELRAHGFFRCHKSFLVNLGFVESYNRQEILMENGERIALAKRRYEEFCREILDYMQRNGGIL